MDALTIMQLQPKEALFNIQPRMTIGLQNLSLVVSKFTETKLRTLLHIYACGVYIIWSGTHLAGAFFGLTVSQSFTLGGLRLWTNDLLTTVLTLQGTVVANTVESKEL